MHPDLKAVVEVQQLDQRVAELTVQIDSLPTQIQTLQSQLDDFIHTHEERKKRLAANLKERKDLEGDSKVIQEKITKHKDQLYQVKTNEQYRAMLKEIEGEEGNNRKIEDQILEKMIEAEDIQKHVQEAAARLEGEKARVAAEIKRLQDERQKELDERGRLQARRKEVAAALSGSVLALYERIRSYRPGAAVVEVRDGLCTACNVRLRPQVYNEVRTGEAVLTCENCSRILYYLEPPAAEQAAGGGEGTRVTMS
ncbi:MAG: C4-type zinc ribbon domain-containing protein [Terriglobia bacterium]